MNWRTSTGNVFQDVSRDFQSVGIYEWEANIITLYVLLSVILLGKTPFRTVGCQRNIHSVRGVYNEELQSPSVWQDRSRRQSAASSHETIVVSTNLTHWFWSEELQCDLGKAIKVTCRTDGRDAAGFCEEWLKWQAAGKRWPKMSRARERERERHRERESNVEQWIYLGFLHG